MKLVCRKLPRKMQQPIVGTLIMISMTCGLPAIMIWQKGVAGPAFWSAWANSILTVAPYSVLLATASFLLFNMLVSRFLVEPAPRS
ncbi:hypothetical protein [Pseudovibrio exalbescens]|uniref:hypothetical protein n=1 Tax=Pseudovibrio exalbescens TaxID=197461 RepID=UPI000AD37F3A|nr:hypothetical protein [Pseudovibrio exalbescens]